MKQMKKENSNATQLILRYTKGEMRYFTIAFCMMVVGVGLNLISPILLGKATTILSEDTIDIQMMIKIIILYVCIIATFCVIEYVQTLILAKTGDRIIYKMREDVFQSLEKLSIDQLNQTPVGKLVTRLTSDTDALNNMYTSTIVNLIKNSLTIIGVVIAMFIVDVEITCWVLMTMPLIVVMTVVFRKLARKIYRKVRKGISNVNTSLSENISGVKLTQIFNQEEKQCQSFSKVNQDLKHNYSKQILLFGLFRPFIYAIYVMTIVLLFYIAGHKIIDSEFVIKSGLIVTFYAYVEQLYTPIQQLAEQFNVLESAMAAAERLDEVLRTVPDIMDSEDAIEIETLKGEIEFKHVWFAYVDEEWILKDVSFKVNPGESIAFVGATGSGKTTILSLIVRNYDIQKGEIFIDGRDIKSYKIASLRKCIGQMLQDVFLFSGTVRSNITLREESITTSEIEEACQFVNANHVIEKLPNGFDEMVLERGKNFSSGERQLISFARVVCHQPNVMILDEATSNIDTETEGLIQDSLKKMMNIGTMLIVAHRLSTIQHCDKIIVIQKGRIKEEGNHKELLALKGHYYNLYKLQYEKYE